jgi:hypothetical protein
MVVRYRVAGLVAVLNSLRADIERRERLAAGLVAGLSRVGIRSILSRGQVRSWQAGQARSCQAQS